MAAFSTIQPENYARKTFHDYFDAGLNIEEAMQKYEGNFASASSEIANAQMDSRISKPRLLFTSVKNHFQLLSLHPSCREIS